MRGLSSWWSRWRTRWKSTPGLPNLTTSSWPLRFGSTSTLILHVYCTTFIYWNLSFCTIHRHPPSLRLLLLHWVSSRSLSVSPSVIHWAAAPSPAGRPHGGGRPEVKGHLWLQRGLPRHRRGLGQPLRHLHPLTCKCRAVWVCIFWKSNELDWRATRMLGIAVYFGPSCSLPSASPADLPLCQGHRVSWGLASRNTMTFSWQITSLTDLLSCR